MHPNESGLKVAVVENGVVHLRKIAVVRDLGREVEINSGIKRGDHPAVDLADRSKVGTRPRYRHPDPAPDAAPAALGTPILKRYLMVRPIFPAYVFPERPTALAPGGGVLEGRRADGARQPYAPDEAGGRCPAPFAVKPMAFAGR